MEYFAVLVLLLVVAIIINLILGIIDLRIKTYALDMLEDYIENGKPQPIALSEGQARAIAKLVKQLMMEDKEWDIQF